MRSARWEYEVALLAVQTEAVRHLAQRRRFVEERRVAARIARNAAYVGELIDEFVHFKDKYKDKERAA